MTEKALFIPLCTEWFRAFEAGTKNIEYREYGARWNERTCRIGRAAVLSHGYGKSARLARQVSGFAKISRCFANEAAQQIFPNAEFIAAIQLTETT